MQPQGDKRTTTRNNTLLCCFNTPCCYTHGGKHRIQFGYVRSISFCLFTILALALSITFVTHPLGRIKLQDIRSADPKYGNFLVDVVFPSNIPEFIELQTLGEYSSFTKVPKDAHMFGLTQVQTNIIRPLLESILKSPVVKQYMQIPSFVGLNGKKVVTNTIVLASPLWIFEHNLHTLDESVCGNVSTRINIQHSTTMLAPTGDIVVWPGQYRACVPATPTAVHYRRCYENINRHRWMVFLQAVVWVFLLSVHIVVFFLHGFLLWVQESTRVKIAIWTETLQGGALVVVICLEIFEWSHGISDAVSSSAVSECPDKQTGLAMLYECLFAAHIFKWLSLILLFVKYFED